MGLKETLTSLGDQVSGLTGKILDLIPSTLLSSPTTAKIVSLIIYLGVIMVILKFAGSISKVMRWIIIGLFVLLIISVLATLVGI